MSRRTNIITAFVAALAAGSMFISCGPSAYTMNVERRAPGVSGMDLTGKTMSVLCISEENINDSSDIYMVAEQFAKALESDYYGGEKVFDIITIKDETPKNYFVKDSLVNFIIQTGSDVVFLLDNSNVYAYDSLDPSDKMFIFHSDAILSRRGTSLATPFKSTWIEGRYSFYIYDNSTWIDIATELFETYNWSKAIDAWIPLLSTQNLEKKACVEYNIAQACYLIGNYDLATQWLDMADTHFDLTLSPGLRKRIVSSLK